MSTNNINMFWGVVEKKFILRNTTQKAPTFFYIRLILINSYAVRPVINEDRKEQIKIIALYMRKHIRRNHKNF